MDIAIHMKFSFVLPVEVHVATVGYEYVLPVEVCSGSSSVRGDAAGCLVARH